MVKTTMLVLKKTPHFEQTNAVVSPDFKKCYPLSINLK